MKLVEFPPVPAWVNETFFHKLCKSIISDKDFKVNLDRLYLLAVWNYVLLNNSFSHIELQ